MIKYNTSITILAAMLAVCFSSSRLCAETAAEPRGKEKTNSKQVHRIEVQVGSEGVPPDALDTSDPAFDAFAAGFDPFREMAAIQARIQNLMNDNRVRSVGDDLSQTLSQPATFQPPVNIEDRGDALSITLDLPGMKKEDIQITLKNKILIVSGQRQEAREEKRGGDGKGVYYRQERFTGSFKRSIRLPAQVREDSIKARYEQGVLTIEAAKDQSPEAQGKQIKVE